MMCTEMYQCISQFPIEIEECKLHFSSFKFEKFALKIVEDT